MKCIKVLNSPSGIEGQFKIVGTIYETGEVITNTNDFNVIMQLLRIMPRPTELQNNEFAYTFAFDL